MSVTIVWDVDDVLNDLTRAWFCGQWVPAHPGSGFSYEGLTENPPHGLLGMGADEYLADLDRFRLSQAYQTLEPQPRVLAWLQSHGEECRHVALTATPLLTAPSTAAWVLRHFGRWIREFAFIPSHRSGHDLPIYDADKGAWLARLDGARILVDDSLENVAAAERAGCTGVRWPRPWNGVQADVLETLDSLTRHVREGGRA